MDQKKTPLFDAINRLIDTKPAYFRIPGHRMEKGINQKWTDKVGTQIFAYDVTETPYTDDLHSPEGAIKEAEELMSQLYSSDASYFLVNGTTCGNEAMIISSAFEGQKIMIARNAHKSAMMGMVLSGAKPVYVMPEVLEEWGIQGGITSDSVRRSFEENPDCKALFLVSPSYYGITSDLEEIAKVCHEYGALLLVDEAHGGHVYFHDELPMGALQAGADICVHSMHKVTGALGQSSVMHVKSKLLSDYEREQIALNLHLVQSTSPSYLLMTSLDLSRQQLACEGRKMMEEAVKMAEYARKKINIIPGFRCMDKDIVGKNGVAGLDITRLVISAHDMGLTGFELEELLFEKYAVNMELSDYQNVLAIVTYANTYEDMDRLVNACEEISQQHFATKKDKFTNARKDCEASFPGIPKQVMTPRQAYFSTAKEVSWKECVGRISAEMIAPYPPGIPVVYPGEEITEEVWNYLEWFRLNNRHIHGSKDGKLETINVITE